MKVFPAVVIVLLAFAAFFMTFLVAPLAVLTIFYVIFAVHSSHPRHGPEPQPRRALALGPQVEVASDPAPMRRTRLTVASHSERAPEQGDEAEPTPGAATVASPGSGASASTRQDS